MGLFDDIGGTLSGVGGGLGKVFGGVGSLVGGPVQGIAGSFTKQPNPGDVQQFVTPEQIQAQQIAAGAYPYYQSKYNWSGDVGQDQAISAGRQQQEFADALKQQAAGGGPSPSETMLKQAAAQQAATANSIAASQRGVNPALAMKMAQDTAARAQQNAVANAVVSRQQEQLRAQQMLGGTLGTMGQQGIQTGLGYNQLANQAGQMGLQANTANAQLAQQAALANQSANMGAQEFNTNKAFGNADTQNKATAGAMSGLAGLMGMGGKGPGSSGVPGSGSGVTSGEDASLGADGLPLAAAAVARGGKIGGHASVPGDDTENDKVHALLSPGEIVIPRTKANDPDKAKAFVAAILAQEKKRGGNVQYGDVLKVKKKGRKAA